MGCTGARASARSTSSGRPSSPTHPGILRDQRDDQPLPNAPCLSSLWSRRSAELTDADLRAVPGLNLRARKRLLATVSAAGPADPAAAGGGTPLRPPATPLPSAGAGNGNSAGNGVGSAGNGGNGGSAGSAGNGNSERPRSPEETTEAVHSLLKYRQSLLPPPQQQQQPQPPQPPEPPASTFTMTPVPAPAPGPGTVRPGTVSLSKGAKGYGDTSKGLGCQFARPFRDQRDDMQGRLSLWLLSPSHILSDHNICVGAGCSRWTAEERGEGKKREGCAQWAHSVTQWLPR